MHAVTSHSLKSELETLGKISLFVKDLPSTVKFPRTAAEDSVIEINNPQLKRILVSHDLVLRRFKQARFLWKSYRI